MFSNDLFFTKHECITKGELKAAALAGNILGQFACAKIIAQVDAKSFVRAITKAHTYTTSLAFSLPVESDIPVLSTNSSGLLERHTPKEGPTSR